MGLLSGSCVRHRFGEREGANKIYVRDPKG